MSSHYVVHVKVEKVTQTPPPSATVRSGAWGDERRVQVATAGSRSVEEVLVFTAKHASLDTVINRVAAHLRIEATDGSDGVETR